MKTTKEKKKEKQNSRFNPLKGYPEKKKKSFTLIKV